MALNGMMRSVNAGGDVDADAVAGGAVGEQERRRRLRELEAMRLRLEAALPGSSAGAPGSAPGPVHEPERQPTMQPGLSLDRPPPLPAGGPESRVELGLRGLRGDVDAEALAARGGEVEGTLPVPGAGAGAGAGEAIPMPVQPASQPEVGQLQRVFESTPRPGGAAAQPAAGGVSSSLTEQPGEGLANGQVRPVLPDGEGAGAAGPNEKNGEDEQAAVAAMGHVAVPQPGRGDPVNAEPGATPGPARVAGVQTAANPEAGGGLGAHTQPQAPGQAQLPQPSQQPLSAQGRQQAEQELAALQGRAMQGLPVLLEQLVKDGEGFFVSDHDRQDAVLAAARLRELKENPDSATLTDQDLNFLYQFSHGKSWVRSMHGLKQQLHADDGLQRQLAEQRREETLLTQQPEVWAARQQQKLQGMSQMQLSSHVAQQRQALTRRQEALGSKRAPLDRRDQQMIAEVRALQAENAHLLAAAGLPDVAAGPGGQAVPAVHPALSGRYAELTRRLNLWDAESAPLRQQIGREEAEIHLQSQVHEYAGSLLSTNKQHAEQQQAEALEGIGQEGTPGAALMSREMQAAHAGYQARLRQLESQYPDGVPPAAAQALAAEMQAQGHAATLRAQQRLEAAQAAYAGLKAQISESPDLAPALRGNVRNNLAQALNLTKEQAQALLDDVENMDWEVPLSRQLERPLNLMERISGEHPKARVLTNGSIIVHPAFHGDEQAYRAAVAAAPEATPEARQRALAAWPQVQRQWAAQMAPGLMEEQDIPGLPSFMKWREEQISQDQATRGQTGFTKLDTEDQVLRYVAEMKNRPGWQKYTDTFVRRFISAGGSVGASLLGLAAMTQKLNPLNYLLQKTTNVDLSEMLAEGAASWSRSNGTISGSLALKGGLDTLGLKATAVFADMVPQFGSMVMGGSVLKGLQAARGLQAVQLGRWATAGLNGAQSAGQAFASTYTQLRGQGLTHEQAFSRTLPAAVGSGVATAALGLVMDKLGASALKDPARALNTPAVRQGMREALVMQMRSLTAKAAGGGAALGKEMTEEMADGLVNQVIENVALNAGASLEQVIADTLQQSPDTLMAIAEMGAMGRAGHVRLGGGGGAPGRHQPPGQSLPPLSLPAYAQAAAPGAAAGPQSPPQTMAAPQQATAHSLPPQQQHGTPRPGVQQSPPGMDSPAAATLPVGDSPPGSLPDLPPGSGIGSGAAPAPAAASWADSPPQVPQAQVQTQPPVPAQVSAEPVAMAVAVPTAAGPAASGLASPALPPAPQQIQAQTRTQGQPQAQAQAAAPPVPVNAQAQTPPQGTAQPAAGRPLPGGDATPGTHQRLPVEPGRVPAIAEPGVPPPPPLPQAQPRVNDAAAAMRAHETFGHSQPPGPQPPPLLRGPADASGRGVEIMARLPDGRFHVRSGGQDVALPPAQAAQAVGLPLADFESRMAQATQAALAAPRPAAGSPPAAPPIWQGRARHGDYAEVISRNPDGTFQVRVAGKELTRTERDVAYMTGLTKAPLYAMLTKATEGRMGGFMNGQPRVKNGVDAAPEESGDLSADDWFKHMPVRGSFGGELFDMSQLDAIEKELAEHGVELVRNAEEFLANTNGGIAAGFQALGPNRAKFYLKSNATVREVNHELVHFRQFRDHGYDGYMAMRNGRHEIEVWEWFLKNPHIMQRLNSSEQDAEWKNYTYWKARMK